MPAQRTTTGALARFFNTLTGTLSTGELMVINPLARNDHVQAAVQYANMLTTLFPTAPEMLAYPLPGANPHTNTHKHTGPRGGKCPGVGWAGLKPTQPAQRSSTPGLSPAHSSSAASQLRSERRPGALPPTGAESSGCLRNARHCLRTDSGRLVCAQRVQGMKRGQCEGSQAAGCPLLTALQPY